MQQPNIFEHTDYRTYVRHYYQFAKSKRRGFSYRQLARDIGLKSPDYLSLVLDGKRNLVSQNATALANALKLKSNAKDYFLALVSFNQASPANKSAHWERVVKLAPISTVAIGSAESRLFQHWFILALYELTTLAEFREDPEWIAKKFRGLASPRDITTAIEILVGSGFLLRDSGRLTKAKGSLLGGGVPSEVVRNFHAKMLDIAKIALHDLPFATRSFTSSVLAIPESRYDEFRQRVDQFQKEIMKMATAGTSDNVNMIYQFSTQLIPLTISENPND